MTDKTVLISGAGVAGSTLAYWLARRGFKPTVVERAQGLRSSGNPVDVRGVAVDVAERMGVLPALREVATQVTALRLVDAHGRQLGRMDLRPSARASGAEEVEVPRAELARVLLEASRDQAEFLFDESIESMSQGAGGVDVRLASGAQRRFDLVIGADGLHSAVRRMTFGTNAATNRHLGLFVGTLPLADAGGILDKPHEVVMYNEPGISASVHPGAGKPIAAFIFRSPDRADFDYRDMAQHKAIIAEHYSGAGWRVPELLERVRATDDLYFDAVSQIRLDSWSRGRVALLGDAASSVSLFGEGSSLAIIGASTLAEALASCPDRTTAFEKYEQAHRALVAPKQRAVAQAARLLVPASRFGIATRNAAVGLMSAASWIGSAFRPGSTGASTPADRRS